MSRFMDGIYNLVKKEYCSAMLYDDINISRLMVHGQSSEVSILEEKKKELKSDLDQRTLILGIFF